MRCRRSWAVGGQRRVEGALATLLPIGFRHPGRAHLCILLYIPAPYRCRTSLSPCRHPSTSPQPHTFNPQPSRTPLSWCISSTFLRVLLITLVQQEVLNHFHVLPTEECPASSTPAGRFQRLHFYGIRGHPRSLLYLSSSSFAAFGDSILNTSLFLLHISSSFHTSHHEIY